MPIFQFGDPAAPLTGYYHPPQLRARHLPAVLMCNPFGEEALRAFRLFRLLAERLSAAGVPVLRFDYFGTGDSAGDCEAVRFAGMVSDIHEAHDELLTLSAAPRALWLGLRLGGSAALTAATERTDAPAGLILWEPVVHGKDYIASLLALRDKALKGTIGEREAGALPLGEVLGFAVPQALERELAALDLTGIEDRPARRIMIVPDSDAGTDKALAEGLMDTGAHVDLIDRPDDPAWNSDRAMNDYIIPAQTISVIEARIGAWR